MAKRRITPVKKRKKFLEMLQDEFRYTPKNDYRAPAGAL
jgi:hypothetical protein